MKQWLDRYGPWLALLIASAGYYHRFLSATGTGVTLYSQAAQCLLDNQILQNCAPPFTYPPAFAFVMIPLALMPMWLRELVWYLVTIAASVGSFKLAERIAARLFTASFTATELVWVRTFSIILSIKFVLAVFENQAYDAFSLIFMLLGLAALADEQETAGGAALGFAAAIKATPLIFLPYLLFKRRFVAAGAFVVVLVIASYATDIFFTPAGAIGGYFSTWLHQVAGASAGIDPKSAKLAFWAGLNAMNHSLHGAVSLHIDEFREPDLFKIVVYTLDLIFIAIAGAMIALRKPSRDMIAIDGSILLIGMLMLSPMTSRSHYIFLILPYTTLVMVMLRDQTARGIGIAVLSVSFFFLTLTSNDVIGKNISDWAYFNSFLVIGALTLMIYIGVIVWKPAVLRDAKPFSWNGWSPFKRLQRPSAPATQKQR